jgi:hypothetical protein
MANQGLGKTLYRGFTKTVKAIQKSYRNGFYDGYGLDASSYEAAMENALFIYNADMQANDAPNQDLWRERAQSLVESLRLDFEEEFPSLFDQVQFVEEVSDFDDLEQLEEQEGSLPDEYYSEYITVGGIDYQVVHPDDKRYFVSMGYKRRSTISPSMADLETYVQGVPYIVGIEFVYNHGEFEGFVVWIEYN